MAHLLWGVAIVCAVPVAAGEPAERPPLSIGEDGAVLRDGVSYRGIGVNYFDAFIRTLHDPEDTSYEAGFQELQRHEIPFARFAACGFWPVDMRLYFDDKEKYFSLLDNVVAAAEAHEVGLIPSLFWHSACVPDLVGEPCNQWGNPESKTIAFMRQYTSEVVRRYVGSRAIWAWELGNEYNLAADLPNAADHRPWVVPDRGTAAARSEADDLRHDMIVTAFTEFAREVRKHDPSRPITTGNSIPRPSAHHQRMELSWTPDSREEFIQNLIEVTPEPMDVISVHLYAHALHRRFGEEHVAHEDLLALSMEAAQRSRKALFVGEFGAGGNEVSAGPGSERGDNFALLNAIERSAVPLAALWVFDFAHQAKDLSITPDNKRAYLLDALANANRRTRACESGLHRNTMASASLNGDVRDNAGNTGRQGNGLNPLYYVAFPGQNVFRDDHVGLNFEHVFNGVAADRGRSRFSPRTDPCRISASSEDSTALEWPAEGSSWNAACQATFTMRDDAIDLAFSIVPHEPVWGQGYLAMMWASYMNHARERAIHFYGRDKGREGWVAFGEDTGDGFETGTIRWDGAEPLPYEEGAEALNIVEHPTKTFLLPFFYGLVDGDGRAETADDTLAYVMMFDQRESIRFAVWNFIRDHEDRPDPASPAWDWQFVVRNPNVGGEYGYRARLCVLPFTDAESLRREYETWAASLSP